MPERHTNFLPALRASQPGWAYALALGTAAGVDEELFSTRHMVAVQLLAAAGVPMGRNALEGEQQRDGMVGSTDLAWRLRCGACRGREGHVRIRPGQA